MNLCIDVGNTSIKYHLFENDVLIHSFVNHFEWNDYNIKQAILSVVGPEPQSVISILKTKQIPYLFVHSKIKLPFQMQYKTPRSLGADRIALVAGALKNFKPPLMIIDAGTCITYDYLDEKENYLGGAISPGLMIRFKSLNQYTDKLPLLNIPREIPPIVGGNTIESINSGVVNGVINEIKGFINSWKQNYPDAKVILTGGDASFLHSSLKNMIFAIHNNLLAEGLNYLLKINTSNE